MASLMVGYRTIRPTMRIAKASASILGQCIELYCTSPAP